MIDTGYLMDRIRNAFYVDDIDQAVLQELRSDIEEIKRSGAPVTQDIIDRVVMLHSREIMGTILGNIRKSMPGKSGIRRALPYLFKEAVERQGLEVELDGVYNKRRIDALIRWGTTWVPISLTYGEEMKSWSGIIHLNFNPKKPSESDFIVEFLNDPPYYEMLLASKFLSLLRGGHRIRGVRFNVRSEVLYNIWRFYRSRKYLVVPGPRIGMQLYDLEIIGFNRHLVKVMDRVPKLPAKQYSRYRNVIIITSKGKPRRDGRLLVLPLSRVISMLDNDGILE